LSADGDVLTAAQRAEIEELVAQTEALARSDDHHAIDAAVEALAAGTESFAALRMNRGIQAALTGRRVDDV
jgi:molecular chaperone HscA